MFKRVFLQISVGIAFGAATLTAQAADITGAGASFPYPIYAKWAAQYHQETGNRVNYQSIGSGGGIRQFTEGTVDFGATDGPMNESQIQAVSGNVLHVPTVLGAVVVVGLLAASGIACRVRCFLRSRSGNSSGEVICYTQSGNFY